MAWREAKRTSGYSVLDEIISACSKLFKPAKSDEVQYAKTLPAELPSVVRLYHNLKKTTVKYDDKTYVTSYKKTFDSENAMKSEKFLYDHFEDILAEFAPEHKSVRVLDSGTDEDGKWYIETSFVNGETLFDRLRDEQNPDVRKKWVHASLKESLLHHVTAPLSLFRKDHGGGKAHQGVTRFIEEMKKEGIDCDNKTYHIGVNAILENFLKKETPYLDCWGKNIITSDISYISDARATKIDWNKFGFFKGGMFFDLVHIIDAFEQQGSHEKRGYLDFAYQTYHSLVAKWNQHVQSKRADPTATMLHLTRYIDDIAERHRVADVIQANKLSSLEDYLILLDQNNVEEESLNLFRNYVSNMKKRDVIDSKEFVLSYLAARVVRGLALSGSYGEFRKKANNEKDKEFFKVEEMHHLQNAVDGVRKLEQHSLLNVNDYRVFMNLFKLRVAMENTYDALHKKVATEVKPYESIAPLIGFVGPKEYLQYRIPA